MPRPAPAHDTRFRFLLVPGAFAECTPEVGFPFETSTALLQKRGYRIDKIFVSGRSSSDHNADQIAAALAEIDIEDSDKLVLIGYSKGATDVLHFLVNYPELSEKVTACLSVAGAINGTPLADSFADTYLGWFAEISLTNCGPGDKGVLESLKRSNQLRWLAAHPLPRKVHYFSIAAFANRDTIQPVLHPLYDLLVSIDPRNDGQLIFYDQVIPGASLLGYVNADHWDVAVPISKRSGERTAAERSLLRDSLFEAMVLFLVENLQESPKNKGF
jgi:pimeloyl-ACP methyl ester carboxylesterase